MSTILVYTSPAAGHLFPLVPGMQALQGRGHDVVVYTESGLVDATRDAGLTAFAVDPAIEAIEPTDYQATSDKERMTRGVADIMTRGRHEIGDLRRAIDAHDPDLLIIDFNTYGAAVAAEASGLPWTISMPTLLPLPGRGIPPFGMGLKPMRGPIGRVRDSVLSAAIMRMYGKVMLPELNAMRVDCGLAPLQSITDHMLAPDRMLVLTDGPLEYPRRDLPDSITFVGAQPWDPPQDEVPAWLLEEGDPFVLVTCSTDYQGDEQLAAAAIEALRSEPVRVIVTLADAAGNATELPHADNVRLERFVPHGPVLERAAAVICHGGMGIVGKAVAAGVPIVAVPFGRDQPEVARRVSEAGAGVMIKPKTLTTGRLRDAVRFVRALSTVERASAIHRANARPERFADAIEAVARERATVTV